MLNHNQTAGHILIVEDSHATAKILAKILNCHGYTTSIAPDGELALAAVRQAPPDLIIIDLMLPKLSGTEVCKQIKNDPDLPFIYAIVLTSLWGKIEETLGAEVKADDYMQKPFNQKEMLARIYSGMRIARLQNSLRDSLRKVEEQQRELLVAEKMAAIGVLVSGIAHEINNPLAIVSNAQQLLDRDVKKLFELQELYDSLILPEPELRKIEQRKAEQHYAFLKEDISDSIGFGLKGIERIKTIIQRLQIFKNKDFSVYTNGQINQALKIAALSIVPDDRSKVTIVEDYASTCQIPLNLDQLTFAFSNILANAIDAVRGKSDGRIEITTVDLPDTIVCEICDNGKGIPPALCSKIFDPFFTTKEVGAGMGLGLTTAYYLLKMHNASIQVDSAPSGGASIKIVFALEKRT